MAFSLEVNKIAARLEKTPPITLALVTLTIVLSTITSYVRSSTYETLKATNANVLWEDIVIPGLQVVPAQVAFHPWTLWTATFVEITPHQFIIGLVVVYFGASWLEEQWNPKYNETMGADKALVPETFKYLSVVAVFTNLISVLVIIVGNTFVAPTPELLTHPLGYGMYNFIIPLAVVAKQLQPERNVTLFSRFKFRLKRVPFALLAGSFVVSVMCWRSWPLLPALVSFLVSWTYLRYFQTLQESNILPDARTSVVVGDASDTFDMVEFFPEALKPVLRPFFNACYDGAVVLGVVRAWNDDDVETGNLRRQNRATNASAFTDIDSEPSGNERRKQMGLKVLEEGA